MKILLGIIVIGFAMLGLAIGIIFKRPLIFGRCSGHGKIVYDGEEISCPSCNKDSIKCKNTDAV